MIRKRAITLFLLLLAPVLTASGQPGTYLQLFVTSDRCLACHNGLTTPQGEDISIGSQWRPSMMANSARDPYWQAAIRRETLVHPTARSVIENECSACHMPMMRFSARAGGQMGQVFAHLPVNAAGTPEAMLAVDGVSCSMCHQITGEKFGLRESFTAGFVVDTRTASGQRHVFGPYEIDEGRKSLMRSSSLFIPAESSHIRESELCATCHTLFTHALDARGEVIGELPEQVPYLEWKHSSYAASISCQSCHMPQVEQEAHISSVMGKPRDNISRHVFRGGNFFIPRMLNRFRSELGVRALPQELEATSLRSAEHLATSAARIEVESADIREGRLEARIFIENLAGHKLPTAYPSRRSWIHLTVEDGGGNVIFESGRLKADGSITGNANDADRELYEPHYTRIEAPDQVQIYEAILAGPDDRVTTVLLTADHYAKDNRLLPDGFNKSTADKDISVKGSAGPDQDFLDGGDRILYAIDVSGSSGPFRIRAELWYQPISYRWAHNLALQEAPEIQRFVAYYDGMSQISGTLLAKGSAIAE